MIYLKFDILLIVFSALPIYRSVFLLDIDRGEWLAVIICIGAVFMAEGFNSAVEAVCDLVSPEHHPLVKRAKDIAAGAVLLMAVAALACGCIIFLPRLIALFS